MNCKKCSKGDAGKEGTDSQDSAKWLCFHLRIRFRLVAQLFCELFERVTFTLFVSAIKGIKFLLAHCLKFSKINFKLARHTPHKTHYCS
jgi:hypothetical protein